MVATPTFRHSQAKVGAALELHAGQKDATRGHEGSDGGGSGVGGSEGVVARNANNCLNGNFREAVAANWPVREGWRDVWSVIRVFLFDTANGGVKRLTKRMTSRQNGSWLRVCRLSTSFVRVYERPRQVSYGCECTAHQCRRIKDAKEDRLKRVPLLMSSHEIYENFSSSRLLLRSRVTRFSSRFPPRRFRLGPDVLPYDTVAVALVEQRNQVFVSKSSISREKDTYTRISLSFRLVAAAAICRKPLARIEP